MSTTTAVIVAAMVLSGCASAPAPRAPAPIDATVAWQSLAKELPGTWTTTTAEPFEVSYRLFSNQSALVETWGTNPKRQTLSVYHPDGRSLVMTHYCAQQNQARLRATEASAERVVFAFEAATNVLPGAGVMHQLSFVFGPDTLERIEIYESEGAPPERSVYRFTRKR
ncbi:MAG: hypothetical protein U1E65_34885 [Myxococcota bacterium]